MKQRYAFGISLMGILLGILLGTGRVAAQTTDDHNSADQGHGFTVNGQYYTCGSHWAADYDYDAALERTRTNNPALYQRMVARAAAHEKGERWSRTQGGGFFFNITDRANPENGFKEIEATLRYNGDSILIFVDDKDNATITDATIEALAKGLTKEVKAGPNTRNPNKGIVYNDIDIFGNPPINQKFEEHIASFLLTDIEEPPGLGGGGIIEGYFSPFDQTNRVGSNETNLLYIDSRQSLINRGQSATAIEGVIGTMAHEFQHLINYNRYQTAGGDVGAHWIYNEGLSEVASLRNGYFERDARSFLSSPNRFSYFSLPTGSADTILRGYERAMLWIHYLSERFGDDFLYKLTATSGQGIEPAKIALGGSDPTAIESVFAEFWVANYIRSDSKFQGDPKFRYQLDVTGTKAGTSGQQIPTTTKSSDVLLKGFAAYLPSYSRLNQNDPDAIKIRFNPAARNYIVHAVKVMSNAIEVQRLEVDQEYTFEKFNSMIFVIVNLYGDGNTVSWTVEGFTSGVDDYATNAGKLNIASIVPNPAQGEAQFNFNTAVAGSVNLTLYDVRGEAVQHVLEGVRYEAGKHSQSINVSDLPAGVYTARLQDEAGAVAVQQFVVVK
ncbi:MAG: T9SS type A sorting domain-containing protein [Ignavibacteriae bacterium]|nr:T9SS type A sorting domain-containing protein [Ignavibacteriota bacterium]MCB9214623.1 T9SS type A sorting domain-containing protein [Ignavibacteria bacterium]